MELTRYAQQSHLTTSRDPLLDVLVLLEFLTSEEYVSTLLTKKHGIPANSAAQRARRVVAHVRTALEYLEQALDGPAAVAFLPTYYGLLNLIKVYILASAHHSRLNDNRWHGAAYDVYAKQSRSLRTEQVVVHPKGAISLFHEVVTGRPIRRKTVVKLGELYPYILDIGAEWALAGGEPELAIGINFEVATLESGEKSARAFVGEPLNRPMLKLAQLPALTNVVRSPQVDQWWIGNRSYPASTSDDEVLRQHVRSFLLYYPRDGMSIVPVCGSRSVLMFEEFPIVLSFFHLSSVVRYNPELLAKLRDSRYWPVVSSLRYHGLTSFLLLFWSFIQQETIFFH